MLKLQLVQQSIVASIVLLACTLQAAQLFNSPVNPRGWQAAHEASEQLVAKLKQRQLQSPDSRPSADEKQSSVLATSQLSGAEGREVEPSDSLPARGVPLQAGCPCGYTLQQLALPALAVAVASALLGCSVRSSRPGAAGAERATHHRTDDSHLQPATAQPDQPSEDERNGPEPQKQADGKCNEAGVAVTQQISPATPTASQLSAEATETADGEPQSQIPGQLLGGARPRKNFADAGSCQPPAPAPDAASQAETAVASQPIADLAPEPGEPRTPHREASTERRLVGASQEVEEGVLSPARARTVLDSRGGPSPGWLGRQDPASGAARCHTVDDVSVVMDALVRRLRLDADAMWPQERMQLLQMALQCCQHTESSWLAAEANEIRMTHATAAVGALAHQKQQAAGAESRRQVERFRAALQDGMMAGLALMLGATLFCGVRCGFLGTQIRRCRSPSSLPALSLWRPWAALEVGTMVLCWAQAASDALLGCCIMLASAYVAVRGGVLRSSPHQAPLLKLVVGLGLVCGCAGCLAVRRLGGDAAHWLLWWEGWVTMHLAAAWQLPALHSVLSTGKWASARMVLHQACLSVVFPVAMAVLPFQGCAAEIPTLVGSLFSA